MLTYAPLVSFAISIATLVLLTRGRMARLAIDKPNERSLHEKPVPRTGGIAILCGIMGGWAFLGPPSISVLVGMIVLVCISFLDDLYSLPVLVRFGAHFLAAGIFALFDLLPVFGLTGTFAAAIAIVWMINLYNFMDGSDGLAGGMALFGFGFYALAAWMTNDKDFALLNMTVATSAGAFLLFNFHPAKIFMGDTGSIPLGFLAAALGLTGWQKADWPFWFPLFVFSPFIVDSTVTLMKRLFRGNKIWLAHKEHYYQRLIRMGLGHRNLALLEYALMLSIGASSLAAVRGSRKIQLILLAGWGFFFLFAMIRIDKRWAHFDE